MRYHNVIISLVSLALAAVVATGTLSSGQFPQASRAESVGFDALAHGLLDDIFSVGAQPDTGPSQ